ncbi:TPA: hypothetical protein ACX6MF_003305 [Photobacterium damselae]
MNFGKQYIFKDIIISIAAFFILVFINPVLSLFIFSVYFINKNDSRFIYVTQILLFIYCFIFIVAFSSRIYGFSLLDINDDAPGYYLWYRDIIVNNDYNIFREFVLWVPVLIISFFYGVVSSGFFYVIIYSYIFILLFFICRHFKNLSLSYLFCFIFLFQVDIYQIAHIFRQVIGMLFFILYIISSIDSKNKRKSYLFLFLSFFSHNFFGLIGAVCEIVRFFSKRKLKVSNVIYFLLILILASLSFRYFVNIPDVAYKIDYYTKGDYSQKLFDKQGLMILTLNIIVFLTAYNYKIRSFCISFFIIQMCFMLYGNWSFLARINMILLPCSFFIMFYSIVVLDNKLSFVKNIIVTVFLSIGLVYTLYVYSLDKFTMISLLSNGKFNNLFIPLPF